MENAAAIGINRTGLNSMAPPVKGRMIEYAQTHASGAPDSDGSFEAVHMAYIEEAERVGSVPLPAGATGAATPAFQAAGRKQEVLIDKLGERLAFERAATRLYEAMLIKCGAADGSSPIDMAALARIRDDEEMHFRFVRRCIERLDADPTAMTPCADLVGVQSAGLMQVISDPRTTIAHSLGALLTCELTDSAGWELLIELAERCGQKDMATELDAALQCEQQHLGMVQGWLRQTVLQEATG
jgi:ferritin-like metal-binding protein YciE